MARVHVVTSRGGTVIGAFWDAGDALLFAQRQTITVFLHSIDMDSEIPLPPVIKESSKLYEAAPLDGAA